MPNWCNNSLRVEGPSESLMDFATKISGDNISYSLSFNALVPLPPEQEDNWYKWHIDNWGTKWDTNPGDVTIQTDFDHENIDYIFDTAWGPPDIWLSTVATLYPNLSFSLLYEELGAGFAGLMICENGKVVSDDVYNYGTPGYTEFVTEHFGDDYLSNFEDEEDEEDEVV